ncbi:MULTISPECIES: SLAP domain-containing protein [unclassified Lactobacillus]|uniref:SLAP domain-containing protein n=1 Tax=unclassified Lactobacillus TaxID=2620435 RepID=UPI000EFDAF8D|nr:MULTISPECIES: SLAP domain-containing protein [unclassified Lactobacillus]RMC44845.1 cell surface protein [Lactobacillus sp. ESL0230]RMC48092.1 cell surface protein [Lactobacillus sp. ESL0225]
MKKNLRIVSAAAAALLAVAPVATSVVSTVSADINVPVEGGTTNTAPAEASIKLNITNVASLAANDPASKVTASLATPTLPTGASVSVSKAKVYTATADATAPAKGKVGSGTEVTQLATGATYYAAATITLTGLTANKEYKITANGTTYTVNADATGTIAGFGIVSDGFNLADATKTGAPYVRENKTDGKAVDAGSVDLTSAQLNVAAVVAAINAKYVAANTTTDANAATASFADVEADVRAALKNAGVTVKADSSFDKPAAAFPVTLNLKSTNGKTATFVVTVNPQAATDDSFPLISYNGTGYVGNKTIDALPDSASFNYVPVNGVVDKKAIEDAFTAKVSNTTGAAAMTPTVDISKVNTKVAGKYPVTVSATNADKKTTKVTFMLTVGTKGATYKTVQSDVDVPVYKITGNTVTDTKTVVKNGDQIATFGDAIVVNGKSYTHINSADSDLYVETKYVDGSVKPGDKVTKKVMHNAYIYDANHKRVGDKTLAAYTNVDVYGKATKLADGSLVYKIGDNQYVMADNIDGTVRTLTHNAYVYKTSTKRADRRVLRKGEKVTTYGNPYKFKNGKSYYRIGGPAKQYVKVANF